MKKIVITLVVFLFSTIATAENLATILGNLSNSNSNIRREAIRTLKGSQYRTKAEVIEPLLNVLRTDSDSINREYAAEALVVNTNPTGMQAVLDTFARADYRISHEAAASALRRVRSPQVKEAFLNNTTHGDQDVRRIVAQGLGNFVSDSVVVGKLKEMVNLDSYSLAREYAAESIAKLPAAQAVPVLAEILNNPNSRGKVAAAEGLRRTKSNLAINPLLSVVNSTDTGLRRSAIRGLTPFINNANVFEALHTRFKIESDSYAQSLLMEAIVKSSDPRALQVARSKINSSDRSIQRYALEAIKRMGDKTDLVELISFLNNSVESIRALAYDAIRAIINRLKSDDPFKTRLGQCLPRVNYSPYSNSTRQTAFYMDLFLGGLGLYSAAAAGKRRTVPRLSPEGVTVLRNLVREMLNGDDIYSDH